MAAKQGIKGTLIPIGGNEDKGIEENEIYSLDFVQEGILSHVVRESGGTSARIVVLPTASGIPKEVGKNYLQAFDQLGCQHVKVLHIEDRAQSEQQDFLKWIEQADCVMFSGGDQSRITERIRHTKMHALLRDRYIKEDFVIAGTSAGAMAMAEEMIAGGSSTESFVKGAVIMKKGMGFMPSLIFDTHFIRRGRFGRLAEAVAIHPSLLGVGLAEDTGLIIKHSNDFRVIGSGMVIVFDASNLTHNFHYRLKQGTPMSMSNLTVHVLANGDSFTVDQKKIDILPVESPFI